MYLKLSVFAYPNIYNSFAGLMTIRRKQRELLLPLSYTNFVQANALALHQFFFNLSVPDQFQIDVRAFYVVNSIVRLIRNKFIENEPCKTYQVGRYCFRNNDKRRFCVPQTIRNTSWRIFLCVYSIRNTT